MKNVLLISILFLTSLAFAGGQTGNGGIGIFLNNKLKMLDLVEYGVEDNPYFDNDIVSDPLIVERVERHFSKFNLVNVPIEKLSKKLTEVIKRDYKLGILLLGSICEYDWRLISTELRATNDDFSPVDKNNLVQIAIRQGSTIHIDRKLWALLDDDQKTVLLFHEGSYAAAYKVNNAQSAVDARSLTGFIFTEKFGNDGFRDYQNRSYKIENKSMDAVLLKKGTLNSYHPMIAVSFGEAAYWRGNRGGNYGGRQFYNTFLIKYEGGKLTVDHTSLNHMCKEYIDFKNDPETRDDFTSTGDRQIQALQVQISVEKYTYRSNDGLIQTGISILDFPNQKALVPVKDLAPIKLPKREYDNVIDCEREFAQAVEGINLKLITYFGVGRN